jgi:hypothetical protein
LVGSSSSSISGRESSSWHAALFTAGKILDDGLPGRQAQGVGGDFHLRFGIVAAGGDDRFEAGLLFGQLVEVGVFLGIGGIHRLQLLLRLGDFTQPGFNRLAYRLLGVEQGLLRQVADLDARLPLHFAFVFLFDAGHDLQHGRFAGAVQTEQADLGAGEEGEGNILDDLPLGRYDFAHAEHRHYVLGHDCSVKREK